MTSPPMTAVILVDFRRHTPTVIGERIRDMLMDKHPNVTEKGKKRERVR